MRNVFVQTQNAKHFITAMKEAERMAGEPILLAFYGPAGRGKTETSRYFAAQEGWTYCRGRKGWQSSSLWMLQDLCFELGIDPIPKRRRPAFEAIVATLKQTAKTMIIDEADKLSEALLDWMRDLVDLTTTPVALVGEKLLKHKMERERRMWSRTLRLVEFEAISTKDILFFTKEATKNDGFPGVALTAHQAEMMRESASGDFRPIKRQVFFIEELIRVNDAKAVTDEMVKIAINKEKKERKSPNGL